ncbi:META domain-containing protein [Microbacterium sp. NPDC056234]|uniref:META domain-containing protein n=1 Tax=Microbacterium sp. NPDC056234 TaxID=3345757 RepID=UPI0035D879AD
MTSHRIRVGLLLAAAAVLLTACATAGGQGTAPTSTASPAGPDVVGSWGSDATGEPFLEFTEDGKVTGTDGCNGIGSTYTVVDDRVEIAPYYSTLKACQGVDDWLRHLSAVQVDGDTLIVMDKSGTKIGELPRS